MVVGIRELKNRTSAVIRSVESGQTVEVTDHGRPVARIVPWRGSRLDQLVAEGKVIPSSGDPREVMRGMGPRLAVPAGMPLPSEILAELRADER
jgi:prevent-host-death family protein